jgi:hypothetical protein
MRGPTYPWIDYGSCDGATEELEKMLDANPIAGVAVPSQIFTERSVLDYFLQVGASWLRRRNRFKHWQRAPLGTPGGHTGPLRLHGEHQRWQTPGF